jgi:hypothetical protein
LRRVYRPIRIGLKSRGNMGSGAALKREASDRIPPELGETVVRVVATGGLRKRHLEAAFRGSSGVLPALPRRLPPPLHQHNPPCYRAPAARRMSSALPNRPSSWIDRANPEACRREAMESAPPARPSFVTMVAEDVG